MICLTTSAGLHHSPCGEDRAGLALTQCNGRHNSCAPSTSGRGHLGAAQINLLYHRPICTTAKQQRQRRQRCSVVCIAVKEEKSTFTTENAATFQPSERLFSNLDPVSLQHSPGSVLGAATLVAGTTVGAGILAVPFATQEAGFLASSGALLGSGVYAIVTGLLLAEVNLNTMCELGCGGSSIVSMAQRTLGTAGMRAASTAYLFLHYTLLVAYIVKGGEVVSQLVGAPMPVGAGVFTAVLGGLCYAASPKQLDRFNGVLVGLVVASFLLLLGSAAGGVDAQQLVRADWGAVPATLPVLALAFVYHNIVPVIVSSLEGDIRRVRLAIVAGVGLPILMFVSWDAAILGSLGGAGDAAGAADPLAQLRKAEGLGPLIDAFSFLAVATSFIGFVLGLADFLADALKLPSGRQPLPYIITLVPPFALALSFPGVFFAALDTAGTYGVLILFGLMPAAMAWNERYTAGSTLTRTQIVPGGPALLLTVGGLALAVIGNELFDVLKHASAT